MEKLIGLNVFVHFKDKSTLSGILFDLDDENIYVDNERIFVIPRCNVKYYSFQNNTAESEDQKQVIKQETPRENTIKVLVNNVFLTKIPYPPNFDVSQPNEDVMRLILTNEIVQNTLAGKVQKKLEYAPGEANIIVVDYVEQKPTESFTMGESDIKNNYVEPLEMVRRLNKIRDNKREKENE